MFYDLTTRNQRLNIEELKPATTKEWIVSFAYAMAGLPAIYFFVVMYSLALK